jgi:acyl transferase domain-containing protein
LENNSSVTGLAGASLAMAALQSQATAPIKHLRNLNPYVVTALADWKKHHGMAAVLPRQRSAATAGAVGQLAGTSSMGMSGVNAHLLLAHTPAAESVPVDKVRLILLTLPSPLNSTCEIKRWGVIRERNKEALGSKPRTANVRVSKFLFQSNLH